MPTGYTSIIKEECTFKKFALTCARNFDACVTMRDDSFDKDIPEKFEESTYEKGRYEESVKKLFELENMTIEEAKVKAEEEYKTTLVDTTERLKNNIKQIELYREMLTQVKAWTPPTLEHFELQRFMRQQIEDSIRFDDMGGFYEKELRDLHPLTGEQWLSKKKKEAKKDIMYYVDKWQEETDRVEGRNKWIQELRNSLE